MFKLENIIAGLIGAAATLIPRIIEFITNKNSKNQKTNVGVMEQLNLENQALRKELRDDIDALKDALEELKKDNERLELENRHLRNRVSDLELQIRYYELVYKDKKKKDSDHA